MKLKTSCCQLWLIRIRIIRICVYFVCIWDAQSNIIRILANSYSFIFIRSLAIRIMWIQLYEFSSEFMVDLKPSKTDFDFDLYRFKQINFVILSDFSVFTA